MRWAQKTRRIQGPPAGYQLRNTRPSLPLSAAKLTDRRLQCFDAGIAQSRGRRVHASVLLGQGGDTLAVTIRLPRLPGKGNRVLQLVGTDVTGRRALARIGPRL